MEKALRKDTETFTWLYLKAAFHLDPVRALWMLAGGARAGGMEHEREAELPVPEWGWIRSTHRCLFAAGEMAKGSSNSLGAKCAELLSVSQVIGRGEMIQMQAAVCFPLSWRSPALAVDFHSSLRDS